MKTWKCSAIISLVIISICATVYGGSMMSGTGCCNGCGSAGQNQEKVQKFQRDTLDLRQDMMNKRFEIERENLKNSPDKSKITALEKEIAGIRATIHEARTKAGLPVCKNPEDCGPMSGNCGQGKMGRCNGKPCPNRPSQK